MQLVISEGGGGGIGLKAVAAISSDAQTDTFLFGKDIDPNFYQKPPPMFKKT